MDLGTDRVPPLLLLPLFSNLSSDQQSKAFEAASKAVRKCVVSTNIAETSVTVRLPAFVCLFAVRGMWGYVWRSPQTYRRVCLFIRPSPSDPNKHRWTASST